MQNEKIWSVLVHLGGNMWNEEGNWNGRAGQPEALASPVLRLDRPVWNSYINTIRDYGANMLIIDVGEGMRYESHPELAVQGSWTHEETAAEVARLRGMGFEVVPKLNFSAGHDLWLGEYSRMLGTQHYREVCADVIREVCEVFKPKYFHLGMDEETWSIQKDYYYAVIRQYEVWWKDFYHLVDCCERGGARPWIWSDYAWAHPEDFYAKMPRDVLMSNWFYGAQFDPTQLAEKGRIRLEAFEELDRHGFDQIPTGSSWAKPENMKLLTQYCVEHISDEHLLGFMQTPWCLCTERNVDTLKLSADTMKDAIDWYKENKA